MTNTQQPNENNQYYPVCSNIAVFSVWCLFPFRSLSHTPMSLHINQTQHCKLLPGLVSSQAQLCRSNLELMQTIIQAAREVKKTCQKTFADMRWNCSSLDIPVDATKYRPDLDRGSLASKAQAPKAALSFLFNVTLDGLTDSKD